MRLLSWKTMAISVLIIFSLPAISMDHRESKNEDLKFIREWKTKQIAGEMAVRLELTQSQVQQLRDMKSACDSLLEAAKIEREQIENRLNAACKKLRMELERNGALSPELEKEVDASRRNLRKLHEKTKMELSLTTLGLTDVLSPEQTQALKSHRREVGGRNKMRKPGRDRGARPERQGKNRIGRLLLSDAFLSHYSETNP
jgi:hypothetical protein